jgi:LPS-assembly lipoprotein
MSWSDPKLRRRALSILLALAGLAAVSACTVTPLYGTAGLETGSVASSRLASVIVKPATTRVGLEVRNHLIFLLNGGAGEPASSAYSVETGVTSVATAGATIQRTRDSEPTAGIVTVTSNYSIVDTKTGSVVASGKRSIPASYDIPRQEFAALRALRDAENRAARELAELLRIAIAQDLERMPAPAT